MPFSDTVQLLLCLLLFVAQSFLKDPPINVVLDTLQALIRDSNHLGGLWSGWSADLRARRTLSGLKGGKVSHLENSALWGLENISGSPCCHVDLYV